jgi:hypothetical protein
MDRLLTQAIVAVVVFITFGPIVYWSLDRSPPVIILGASPTPNPVRGGDVVDMQFRVRSVGRKGCDTVFQRRVTGNDGATLTYEPRPSSYADLPFGEHPMHTTTPFVWSRQISDGPAEIRLTLKYRCNPLQFWWNWPIVYESPPISITSVSGQPLR